MTERLQFCHFGCGDISGRFVTSMKFLPDLVIKFYQNTDTVFMGILLYTMIILKNGMLDYIIYSLILLEIL